jgi:gliding motility-associated-like protein
VNPDLSFSATGLHRITLHATDHYGCEQTISKNAVTVTKPTASFDANGTSSECPPLTTIFRDTSTGNVVKWNWTFGDSKSSTLQNPAYVYVTPGTFDVTLIVTDPNGCTDTTAQAKLIHVGGPYGSFASGVTASSCVFADVPFSTSTTNAVTHHWDFGDGVVTDEGPLPSTRHVYTTVGSYTPSLVLVDDNGCKVIADGDVRVVVNDTTAIEFDYSPKCLFEGESFSAQAAAATDETMSWQWLIGDTPVSMEPQMTLALDSAAEYTIRVQGTNSFGCVSTLSGTVRINGSLLNIPNVFTPNGDASNQYFVIPDLTKSRWDLEVFNRWGRSVYSQKNYANNWDGGQLASGVYYYNVINSFCRDRGYKGVVSILR